MSEAHRCGVSHRFPRDRFAGVRAVTAWCEKPAGHPNAHEGVVGTTAYCWRDRTRDESEPDPT